MMRVPRMARRVWSHLCKPAQSKPPPSDANAEMNGVNPLKTSETPQRNQRGKRGEAWAKTGGKNSVGHAGRLTEVEKDARSVQ